MNNYLFSGLVFCLICINSYGQTPSSAEKVVAKYGECVELYINKSNNGHNCTKEDSLCLLALSRNRLLSDTTKQFIDTSNFSGYLMVSYSTYKKRIQKALWWAENKNNKNNPFPVNDCPQCINEAEFLRNILHVGRYYTSKALYDSSGKDLFRSEFIKAFACFNSNRKCSEFYSGLIDSVILNPSRTAELFEIMNEDSLASMMGDSSFFQKITASLKKAITDSIINDAKLYKLIMQIVNSRKADTLMNDLMLAAATRLSTERLASLYRDSAAFQSKINSVLIKAIQQGSISYDKVDSLLTAITSTLSPDKTSSVLLNMIAAVDQSVRDSVDGALPLGRVKNSLNDWSVRLSKNISRSIFGDDSAGYPEGETLHKVASRSTRLLSGSTKANHTFALIDFFPAGNASKTDTASILILHEKLSKKMVDQGLNVVTIERGHDLESMQKQFVSLQNDAKKSLTGKLFTPLVSHNAALPEFVFIGEYHKDSSGINMRLHLLDGEDGLILGSITQQFPYIGSSDDISAVTLQNGIDAIHDKLFRLLTAFSLVCTNPELVKNTRFDKDLIKSLVLKDIHFTIIPRKDYNHKIQTMEKFKIALQYDPKDTALYRLFTDLSFSFRSFLSKYQPVSTSYVNDDDAVITDFQSVASNPNSIKITFYTIGTEDSRSDYELFTIQLVIPPHARTAMLISEYYKPIILDYVKSQLDLYFAIPVQQNNYQQIRIPELSFLAGFFPAGSSHLIYNKQLYPERGHIPWYRTVWSISLMTGQLFCMVQALRYEYLVNSKMNRLGIDEINSKYIRPEYIYFGMASGLGVCGMISYGIDLHISKKRHTQNRFITNEKQ